MAAMRRILPLAGICLLLFVIAFAILLPGIHQAVGLYDEGVITYGAVRVMDGHVPYRDIWVIYSPAQFYVLAAAFKLFGTSIMVERLWDTAARALLSLASYLIASRLVSLRAALVAWLAVTAWVGYYGFYGYPAFPAIACSFTSILAMTVAFSRRPGQRRRWMALSGAMIGVAALFRVDFAFYGAAGQALALAIFGLLPRLGTGKEPGPPDDTWRQSLPRSIRSATDLALPFALSAALIMVPVTVYFLVQTPFKDLTYDLFTFPTAVFPRFRALPYPALEDLYYLPFYLPFLVYALSGVAVFVMARRRTVEGMSYAMCVLMLTVFGMLSWNQARVRSDLIHTSAFLLPALILIVVLWRGIPRAPDDATDRPENSLAGARMALSFLAVLMLGLILFLPVLYRIDLMTDPRRMSPPITHGLARANTAVVDPAAAQVAHFILANTDPRERIYVGGSVHDRIFGSEAMLYFLAERHSATRYHELHPGVATTAPVQQEIISGLEKHHVRYLVLSSKFAHVREPNESALSSGVKILDEFISSHFLPVKQIGPYTIWQRMPR